MVVTMFVRVSTALLRLIQESEKELGEDGFSITEKDHKEVNPSWQVKRFTVKWALCCEKCLPHPSWLLLNKTVPPFNATLYIFRG